MSEFPVLFGIYRSSHSLLFLFKLSGLTLLNLRTFLMRHPVYKEFWRACVAFDTAIQYAAHRFKLHVGSNKGTFWVCSSGSVGHRWPTDWASECPDVKNYKLQLNPVWSRMLYSCNHVTTLVGFRVLTVAATE